MIVQRATKKGYKFPKPPTVSDPQSWNAALRLMNTKTDPVARPGSSLHRLGIAYDLAGPNPHDIVAGILKASAAKAITLAPPRLHWQNPRLEGHCVHVEILGGRIDFEPFDFV